MVGGRGGVGGGGGNRVEADRWLVTSEKLLASSDLQGAKTFAIRACEADPTRAEAADYILAICDILLAGETRLGDSNLPDWYAVLRLGRLAQNPEHVATQYRRLALLLNPSVNRLPFADRALKIVSDAWFVLSDQFKKSFYDRELQLSQLGQSGFHPQTQSHQNFQWEPSSSTAVYPPPRSQSQAGTSTDPMATSFWTACPYCFVLFEYPKAYEECTLKCQECRRAFQAVTIPKPPVDKKDDEDVYFCSWALFPLGFSGEFQAPSWSPISPLFACPLQKLDGEPKKRKEPGPPRIYYDDDDIYVAISDGDDAGDDGDWQDVVQVNKKTNVGKGKETYVRSNKKHGVEEVQNVESISSATNHAVSIASNAAAVGSSTGFMSKPGSYITRKRMGTGAKNLGRLDLNVEFSNEVEEPGVAGGGNAGNGIGSNREVDNMEGIGFFEGLDEFLNSLPILSVVGDDKIKAT
ncbi:putative DnaJ domain, Chaperone J-domain superfamily [Arabidopsis thaliana]|uniref:EIP9 n=2 Tax=Arabidopsis TaxID=3701 RepID=A0A178U904_ARATH|nr:DnaJ domain [Arabidopsis thaliana x Arabidopsis arenosa]KAG7607248.1 DnaJ domain [Arabidopsis thaliana x Arabidopsis arenosa]OAO90105.1 EIP9 [Arabidopsis thaliana]